MIAVSILLRAIVHPHSIGAHDVDEPPTLFGDLMSSRIRGASADRLLTRWIASSSERLRSCFRRLHFGDAAG
jgi:hypothetical protein